MTTFLIRALRHPRRLQLTDAGGVLRADLTYPRWWSMEAEGVVDGRPLRLRAQGTWKRNYAVELDGRPVGLIRTGRWGRLHIDLLRDGGPPTALVLTHLSFWRRTYALKVENGPALVTLEPVFNWRVLAPDLRLTVVGTGIPAEQLHLLLVLAGAGVRLVMARQAVAA